MSFEVSRIAGWTTSTAINSSGKSVRTHTQKYRIDSTEHVDTFAAQLALGIAEFDTHGTDTDATCRKINTELDATKRDPWVYYSTAEFSTETPDPQQEDRQKENPLDDTVEESVDGETITVPLERDLEDNPIVNGANDPLLGLEGEKQIEVITYVRNEAVRDSARDRAFRGRVNSLPWNGAAAGTLKMRRIASQKQFRNRIPFYRYTYEIAYNEDGWQPTLANLGKFQIRPVSGGGGATEYVPCFDDDNNPVSDPVPLTAEGLQIPHADLPGAANKLEFTTIPEADFAALGLPTS